TQGGPPCTGIAIRGWAESPCQGGSMNAPVGIVMSDFTINYTAVMPQGTAISLCGANNVYMRNVQIVAFASSSDGTFNNISLGRGLLCWNCGISWFDNLVIQGTTSKPPTLAWVRDGIMMVGGGGSNFFRGSEFSQVHNAVHLVGVQGTTSRFSMNVFVD